MSDNPMIDLVLGQWETEELPVYEAGVMGWHWTTDSEGNVAPAWFDGSYWTNGDLYWLNDLPGDVQIVAWMRIPEPAPYRPQEADRRACKKCGAAVQISESCPSCGQINLRRREGGLSV